MTVDSNDRLHNAMQDVLEEMLEPKRKAEIEAEKDAISRLETGDAIVKFIRRGYDTVNRKTLCEKVMNMQEEVLPPLLRRFRTSFQDEVVESTVYILSNADEVYVEQLTEMYPERGTAFDAGKGYQRYQCRGCRIPIHASADGEYDLFVHRWRRDRRRDYFER